MSLVLIPGGGFTMMSHDNASNTVSNITIDAAGESYASIGQLVTSDGQAHTLSAAGGGKIFFRSGSPITFNNAGTTLRLGVQDLNATGIEDGTFDVYADLVGGTDTVATNTIYGVTMEAGTKTMTPGDYVAICAELLSRGGSDSVLISATGSMHVLSGLGTISPYRTVDSGAGPAKAATATASSFVILFDDGALGYIGMNRGIFQTISTSLITYGTSSSHDEHGAAIKVPFKCKIDAVGLLLSSLASTDTWDFKIYKNPTTSPELIYSATIDPDYVASTTTAMYNIRFSEITLEPDTWYAFTVLATSANTLAIGYQDFGASNTFFKKVFPFGEDIKLVRRDNSTGAFSEIQTYYMPCFNMNIKALDNAISVPTTNVIGIS